MRRVQTDACPGRDSDLQRSREHPAARPRDPRPGSVARGAGRGRREPGRHGPARGRRRRERAASRGCWPAPASSASARPTWPASATGSSTATTGSSPWTATARTRRATSRRCSTPRARATSWSARATCPAAGSATGRPTVARSPRSRTSTPARCSGSRCGTAPPAIARYARRGARGGGPLRRPLLRLLVPRGDAVRVQRAGFRIAEVPIVFQDRTAGASKISRREIYRAAWHVLVTAWRREGRRCTSCGLTSASGGAKGALLARSGQLSEGRREADRGAPEDRGERAGMGCRDAARVR